MTGDREFAGSIPELYDSHLVPLIFAFYADDLAERVAAASPRDVLEIAAGTGVVPRALAPRLPRGARYVVTDLNQPMLDRAAARQGADARIVWRQADAMTLDFDDAEFDAVCCQFGVMFLPDRIAAFRGLRWVLRRGGLLAFNVWDRIEANLFADVVTRALAPVFPDDPPRFLARTPHGYHDPDTIRSEVAAAGFGDIRLETLAATSRASTAREVAVAYVQGTPLRGEIEARGAARLAEATEAAAEAIAAEFGPGPVEAAIRAHVVTATA